MSDPRAATRRPPAVVVHEDESLPGVLDRVRAAAAGGHTVHLIVPVESPLLLTANEFRTLKTALDDERLAVVVRTSDPLRLKLGERLGLQMAAAPKRKAPARIAEPPPSPPDVIAEPEEEVYSGPDPILLWPAQVTAVTDEAPETVETAPAQELVRRNPPRRWLPVALLLVLLVVGAAFLFRALTPQAIVRYVPRTQAVSASIVFDATTDGQPLDDGAVLAFPTQQQQVEVTWSGETSASGSETVPDLAASAPIELRNAGAAPVTVDAGTVVTTEDGTEFTFTETVEVPAADTATGKPGAATGEVQATVGGTSGNVGTGEIGGRLSNGIYYSNRMEPTTGGTDKEYRVVAQGDHDALLDQASDAVNDLAAGAVNGENGDQGFVITGVKVLKQEDTFDHNVGDRGDTVSLQSAMSLEVTVVDLKQAEVDFERDLAAELIASAPAGYTVPVKEMVVNPPVVERTDDRGSRLQISADVEARQIIDEAQQRQLAARIAGLSPAEAEAVLAQDPTVAGARVEITPGWLIKNVPENPDRVVFEDEG
ncbi:MAG: baseplate J/gp47 family protein [Chloroflexia bacterium]|nr:baseplate J/gp47 family protein [Chloroflexia bacterium]